MILRHPSLSRAYLHPHVWHRKLAQANDSVGRAPPEAAIFEQQKQIPNALDSQVLNVIKSRAPNAFPSLFHLLDQFDTRAQTVLDSTLAYESTPPPARRVSFNTDDSGVVLLTHALDLGHEHKVTFCSGFAIKGDGRQGSNVIVSCAHTLEEMRRSRFMRDSESQSLSATLSFSRGHGSSAVIAEHVSEVLASLPRSDLVMFSTGAARLKTLPMSPYPARVGTRVRAHFVSESRPSEPGWKPWIHGTWSKWVQGRVLGYRDFAGRESEPGTYDPLSHLLFHPPPSPGSSGGPIVDEESGAVIGVVLGSRMDNRVEGVRGWGVPSETIFEMFKLPGLKHVA